MYPRILQEKIESSLNSERALIIYGPRRVGKTTLATGIGKKHGKYLYLNCDEPDVRKALQDKTSFELRGTIGNHDFVIIDEAQRVTNIGITLKLIVDSKLTKHLIATGSSSFDLANRVNEPLTGRKIIFNLLPLIYAEITSELSSKIERERMLSNLMIYGSYPEIVTTPGLTEKKDYLRELVESTLYKDILEFQKIRNPNKIRDLLRALAFQSGGEVSYAELGQSLELDSQTVESYINLLEQCFIIYRLHPLTRNPRKEISRMRKIFFYDNGVRNALINKFESAAEHPDKGQLWENWAIGERIKLHRTKGDPRSHYFWRLKSGAEIDLVEEQNGKYFGYEYKYSDKKVNQPESWNNLYPNSKWKVIRPSNFDEFGLGDS